MDILKILNDDAVVVAPKLLGCLLVYSSKNQLLIGRIVETEAYNQSDAASHSYRCLTARTAVMFGPPGHVYIYFTYGMHYCMNVVTGGTGQASAVLIRALEPIQGLETMRQNRKVQNINQLTNGPAKLCQAFGLNKDFNGHDLHKKPLQLQIKPISDAEEIITATRVGIKENKDWLWRFYIKNNLFVSRP